MQGREAPDQRGLPIRWGVVTGYYNLYMQIVVQLNDDALPSAYRWYQSNLVAGLEQCVVIAVFGVDSNQQGRQRPKSGVLLEQLLLEGGHGDAFFRFHLGDGRPNNVAGNAKSKHF